jgi:hypothetical protein
MRFLTLASGFWFGAATAANAYPCATALCVGAPAPLIGSGVPVALAAGGVLCGMMLVKLWRRS